MESGGGKKPCPVVIKPPSPQEPPLFMSSELHFLFCHNQASVPKVPGWKPVKLVFAHTLLLDAFTIEQKWHKLVEFLDNYKYKPHWSIRLFGDDVVAFCCLRINERILCSASHRSRDTSTVCTTLV